MIGMLWQNEGKLSLSENIQKAMTYYQQKYGRRPTWCHVNPAVITEAGHIEGLNIKEDRLIVKNNLWLGA